MSILTAIYNGKIIGINNYETNMKGCISCKCCDTSLIAKKGNINAHHFCHVDKNKCDEWYYKDSKCEWHLLWQNICNINYLEKIIIKNDIKHIADIYNEKTKSVIEIQHSNLSKEDIENREIFYQNMIWIIDLKDDSPYIYFMGNKFVMFKAIKKFFTFMKKPVYFDTKYGLLKKIYEFDYSYNICEMVDTKAFLIKYFDGMLKMSVGETAKIIDKNNFSNCVENCSINIKLDIDCVISDRCIVLNGNGCKKLGGYNYSESGCKGLLRHIGFEFSDITKNWYICKCGKCQDEKQRLKQIEKIKNEKIKKEEKEKEERRKREELERENKEKEKEERRKREELERENKEKEKEEMRKREELERENKEKEKIKKEFDCIKRYVDKLFGINCFLTPKVITNDNEKYESCILEIKCKEDCKNNKIPIVIMCDIEKINYDNDVCNISTYLLKKICERTECENITQVPIKVSLCKIVNYYKLDNKNNKIL